tara:strand:+ start:639 stop:764 length:126 start_codon:yes stop_codon:yes gene_type:complete
MALTPDWFYYLCIAEGKSLYFFLALPQHHLRKIIKAAENQK